MHLGKKLLSLFRAKNDLLLIVDPILILEDCMSIPGNFLFRCQPAECRTFQVICSVDILIGRKYIAHDDKMGLATPGKLDSVESVETRQQRVRVVADMLTVTIF